MGLRFAAGETAEAEEARASATLLKTPLRPAATIPSPENTPDRMDGATRGGGSDPARLLRPSAASPTVPTAAG